MVLGHPREWGCHAPPANVGIATQLKALEKAVSVLRGWTQWIAPKGTRASSQSRDKAAQRGWCVDAELRWGSGKES